jgi:hypothetical protein
MAGAPVPSPHRRPQLRALAVLLGTGALLLSGCGGSDAGTTAASGRTASPPAHDLPGIKGERIGSEAATGQHLSRVDCAALRRRAEAQTGRRLALHAEPTPPSSRCRLTAAGVAIGVYLDSARSAHQRYLNRMVEQNQFGLPDLGRVPHPVPHIGDPAPGDQNASWVPAFRTLFATRGNRWLTVAYAVDGVPRPRARADATALARLGFRFTAH